MAASLSFRWLEILEKEFDKAFVDLDLLLGEIDPDQCELTYDGRQKMTALSAAFAQLCHKAQTIFQTNAKLEVSLEFLFSKLTALIYSTDMVVDQVCRLNCCLSSEIIIWHRDLLSLHKRPPFQIRDGAQSLHISVCHDASVFFLTQAATKTKVSSTRGQCMNHGATTF